MNKEPTKEDRREAERDRQILLGGTQMSVSLRDGSAEEVTVRMLPIRDFPRYMELAKHLAQRAELLCGMWAGWADMLTDESLYAITDKGAELNDPRLAVWTERQAMAAEAEARRLMPLLEKTRSAFANLSPKSSPKQD